MDGIINVLKPVGMTSTDIVRWIAKKTGTKKTGHIGTLDPGAAGVLPICVGKATRLAEFHAASQKSYRAEITFGITTDTLDAFGVELSRVKPEITCKELEQVLPKFLGTIEQVPPMYSAIRKNGKHLYEYARQGLEIQRETRQVTIEKIELVEWREDEFPKALLDVECSKGTYIRSLCHDLGQELKCGAHLSFLLRLKAGSFELDAAYTLEEIEHSLAMKNYNFLLSPEWGLNLPAVSIPPNRLAAFKNGLSTNIAVIENSLTDQHKGKQSVGQVQVYCQDRFIGIGAVNGNSLHPEKVLID